RERGPRAGQPPGRCSAHRPNRRRARRGAAQGDLHPRRASARRAERRRRGDRGAAPAVPPSPSRSCPRAAPRPRSRPRPPLHPMDLESSPMAGLELPIFELPLVLLPGEQVPLHIFEERYKRMVGNALDQGEPFGVVLRDDEGARSIGCTARIDDVLERFADGRTNILVSGEAPFKVLDRFESPEYPTGEVELIPDRDIPPVDEESASAAREAFAELAERATGERPDQGELDDASAYSIA